MKPFYDLVAKVGRKMALAALAGVTIFAVTIVGLWIVARVIPDTGEIVADIVKAYLLAAPGIVTAYAVSNAYTEGQHAKAGTAQPKAPPSRPSGTVHTPDGQ